MKEDQHEITLISYSHALHLLNTDPTSLIGSHHLLSVAAG